MKLAQFFQTGQKQILKNFGLTRASISSVITNEQGYTLEGYTREMLDMISEDLRRPRAAPDLSRNISAEAGLEVPEPDDLEHHVKDLAMFQKIQELRTLRATVMHAWSNSRHGLSTEDINALLRFNEAIDQLMVSSVAGNTSPKKRDVYLFEATMKVSPDPSAIFDPSGKLLYLNTPMADIANTTMRAGRGKTPLELDLVCAAELHKAIRAAVTTGTAQRMEFSYPSPSGKELYFDSQLVPVFDNGSNVKAVVKISRDITERKQAERDIWRSANFDLLTGIPNRRLFLDRLEQTLLESKRSNRSFALLFIDLDHFKQANDQLGHEAGDRLLKQVAERIGTKVRAMDTFARLGGDEFTLIFKDVNHEEATNAAGVLLASLQQPFSVDSHLIHLSGSIGVAMFPEDGADTQQLLNNADQAMYAAKKRGGHQVRLYQTC